ncbi:MAG TPA: GNAT family N-acetyltransferase [Candidatus Dormibacteraeota bacterium]
MRPRRVRPEELGELASFCARQFGTEPDYFLRRWLADPAPGSFALVQELNGEPVAHVRVYARNIRLVKEAVPCAALANVAVSSSHRGRGLARSLIEACLQECLDQGFEVALLGTHIPSLYEHFGFKTVQTPDAILRPGNGSGWYEAAALTIEDRRRYSREHGERPGTFVRDEWYWKARDAWLPAEGWRLFRFEQTEGYCWLRGREEGGVVDEAVGECLPRLRERGVVPGRWRWRLPRALSTGLALEQPRTEFKMALSLRPGPDLSSLESPEAVIWRTDDF